MLAAAFRGDFGVRPAEQRRVLAGVETQSRILHAPARSTVELADRPWGAERGARKALSIGRGFVRLTSKDARHLMLPVSVAGRAAEQPYQHMRLERSHHSHHIAEQRIARPVFERFISALGEPEVVCAREVLHPVVKAPGGEKLLRANHSERLAELVPDQILSAISAREREIAGAHVPATREKGNETRVFIIRMRADD